MLPIHIWRVVEAVFVVSVFPDLGITAQIYNFHVTLSVAQLVGEVEYNEWIPVEG